GKVPALIQKSQKAPKDGRNQLNTAGSSCGRMAEDKSDHILKTQLVQQDFSSTEPFRQEAPGDGKIAAQGDLCQTTLADQELCVISLNEIQGTVRRRQRLRNNPGLTQVFEQEG